MLQWLGTISTTSFICPAAFSAYSFMYFIIIPTVSKRLMLFSPSGKPDSTNLASSWSASGFLTYSRTRSFLMVSMSEGLSWRSMRRCE